MPSNIDEDFRKIKVGIFTRKEAVRYLLSLNRAYFNKNNIEDEIMNEDHDIYDIWQRYKFKKEFARKIIHKLVDDKIKLQDIVD